MGTFHAPNVTGEALKTAVFTAALFEGFGFDVTPRYDEPRADIIQAVQLREREALCAFIRGIQQGAPVDSFVVPEPSPMPGYDCDVIMRPARSRSVRPLSFLRTHRCVSRLRHGCRAV